MRIGPLFLLTLFTVTAQAGTLYRWKDDKGITHMETFIPPEETQGGYEVLDDRNFRVIEKVPPALTEEELKAAKAAQAEEARRQREAELQARRDRTLLATYASLDDMQMARDGQLRTIESIIQSVEQTISQQQEHLQSLQERAAQAEQRGRKVPQKTLDAIADTKQQISLNEAALEENRAKRVAIEETFSEDMERFRALKGFDE